MTEIKGKPTELWEPERLKPYPKNAKTHPPEQIRRLANSIKEHGWRGKPIEIKPDGEIINGHGRWQAALSLNMEKVPVTVIDDMSEEEVRKYRLDDNKTAESAWDTELLTEELVWLNDQGVDLLTTFDERDITFATEDLGELDLDALADDIGEQVEKQSEATQKSMDEQDERTYQIAKVLGFAKINSHQQRVLSLMVAHMESTTGKTGAEAFTSFAIDYLGID